MTSDNRILLKIIQAGIRGEKMSQLPEAENLQWGPFLKEARYQCVLMSVCDALTPVSDSIDETARKKYWKITSANTARGIRTAFDQAELTQMLSASGCPYVILKGEAARAYYPAGALRQMGDVDFLVPEFRAEEMAQKIEQLGYTRQTQNPSEHHLVFTKPGSRLEMHIEIAGMPKGAARAKVEQYLEDIFDSAISRDLGSGEFYAPSHAHHGLILLLHMQHHMVEQGIGLRHLIDWACFVEATASEPFWQQRLLPLLQQIGLKQYAAAMTKTAAIYLNTHCPDWAAPVEESLCSELITDILDSGNFGKKDAERARSSHMLPDWESGRQETKLTRLYKSLRHSVVAAQPELEGRPVKRWLKMMGKAIRYVWLFARGQRPNLLKAAGYVDARESLYKKLKMYETE